MADITLSKAVRSNLLSLQNTAALMGKTQERLATGLKVNSALDNPTNFFTASSLNSRASDLGRLLDSVSNAVQTIAAADKGIKAITKLVESAQATARQALQSAAVGAASGGDDETPAPSAVTATSTVALLNDGAAEIAGDADSYTDRATIISGLTDGDTITVNGTELEYQSGGTGDFEDYDTLVTALADLGVTLEEDGDNAGQVLVSSNRDLDISGTVAEAFGIDGTATATSTDIAALTGTIDYEIGEDTGTIDLDLINNVDDLIDAFEAAGFTVSYDADDGFLTIGADESFTLTDGASGEVAAVFGTGVTSGEAVEADEDAGGDDDAGGGAGAAVSKRQQLLDQYNDMLGQISDLARDASFNGVNLLDGDTLSVLFNEDGTSKLDIAGVTFNAAGLGLTTETDGTFDTNNGINGVLDKLKAASETLRTQASTFGSNLSVVETRQNFTKDMINVLETGAANLTLADTNEEAANLLALQTRQQLSTTALSLASQADQNVLRLF